MNRIPGTMIGWGGTPNGVPGPRRVKRGVRPAFTLVEVLATLVLIGIILPVAQRGVTIALAAASSAKHRSEAATLADAKLNQILVESGGTTTAESGDFAPEHPDYHWQLETIPQNYGLSAVNLRVTWIERGQDRALTVSTLSYESSAGVQQ